ncbi:MAG: lipoprotein signal peptidase [Campylobacter sp.]|nr:lipoprotein signal peptidase [Campylobacter sp.]
MVKFWFKFLAVFAFVIVTDQAIKQLFLNGFGWEGEYLSLVLTYNTGVAFSMFSFLGQYLKGVGVLILGGLFIYLLYEKTLLKAHWLAFALLLGGGMSNLIDRFLHPGVVDYVFWHKWFEFAVFNFADVMINLAVAIIFIQVLCSYLKRRKI